MAARRPAHPHHARLALLLPLFLLISAVPALAQENAAAPLSIGAGRLYTTEGREIAFSKFALAPDSASYQTAGESSPHLVPASTVLRVEKQTGNEALKWGAMGGLCGLVGSLLGVSLGDRATDPVTDVTVSSGVKTGIVVGITAVCVGIGLAVGAGQKTYTTVYENPSLKRP